MTLTPAEEARRLRWAPTLEKEIAQLHKRIEEERPDITVSRLQLTRRLIVLDDYLSGRVPLPPHYGAL